MTTYQYYDFFAGGGMAGYGLGQNWRCRFANDIDEKKGKAYRINHNGGGELLIRDVRRLTTADLPGNVDLSWASFPCQDLSLAGAGAGLQGGRSGTFWPFWNLMRTLYAESRAPRVIVIENVYGAVTSHGGRDFAALAASFAELGYRFGALIVDAVHFVPQSRPRFFGVGVRNDLDIPASLMSDAPSKAWHPEKLISAQSALPSKAAKNWIWWHLPAPPARNSRLSDFIEDSPLGVKWHTEAETKYILDLMSDGNLRKVASAKREHRRMVGTVYRRTRPDGKGGKQQRAEVRFDNVSGCLRTPAGGSSRQTILVVNGDTVQSRLLSPREAARLMGLPEDYQLPARYNDAYHLAGDGVVVPVVRHLADHVFEPILSENRLRAAA